MRGRMSSQGRPSVDAVLGPLGAAIMRILWAEGETALGTVIERLGEGQRRPAYTTVTTILSRLRERALVERSRRGRAAVYRAVVSEAQLVEATTEHAVDTVIARFGDVALRHFATRLGDIDPGLRRELIDLARRHRPAREVPSE
ncbi:MAG: BlaI/MecI/CopY family transcriptional regulator [Chloroflexi bacterium]|nr:BlaI/MecI/CopY family transcriptional regulator [Chloroflexota bacterium]